MAKGQVRSNRETKKPKQDKPKKDGASYLSGGSAPLKVQPKPAAAKK